MGMVHRMVVESCADYFVQMRRRVYQTPRSFLSFLGSYKDLYLTKKEEVDVKSKRVVVGLDKLKKGASDVEAMKVQLKEEEIKLKEADLATTKMLSKLEVCIESTSFTEQAVGCRINGKFHLQDGNVRDVFKMEL